MCVYMFVCNSLQCRNIKLCSRVGHAPSHTNNIPLCSYYDICMTATVTVDPWLSELPWTEDFRGFIVKSEMGKNQLIKYQYAFA